MKIAVTYYRALFAAALAAVVLPIAFDHVFGFNGAVEASLIVLPVGIGGTICMIRIQVRHLLKELRDVLSIETARAADAAVS